jgi:ribosome recycling factor
MNSQGLLECKCPHRSGTAVRPDTKERDRKLAKIKAKYGENPQSEKLEEIREELSKFLRSEFKGTAFNQCETQNLLKKSDGHGP